MNYLRLRIFLDSTWDCSSFVENCFRPLVCFPARRLPAPLPVHSRDRLPVSTWTRSALQLRPLINKTKRRFITLRQFFVYLVNLLLDKGVYVYYNPTNICNLNVLYCVCSIQLLHINLFCANKNFLLTYVILLTLTHSLREQLKSRKSIIF